MSMLPLLNEYVPTETYPNNTSSELSSNPQKGKTKYKIRCRSNKNSPLKDELMEVPKFSIIGGVETGVQKT